MTNSSLNRRNFLKLGTAATAGFVAGGRNPASANPFNQQKKKMM